MFAIILASSPASAVENGHESLARHRQEQIHVPRDALSAPEPALAAGSPGLGGLLQGLSRNIGFSLVGGLLLGATVAWAARRDGQAVAQ
jgi:hypothetical protein